MYGPKRPTQLKTTTQSLHTIFPRYANVPSMGRTQRYCSKGSNRSVISATYETAKRRFAGSCKQRRPFSRPLDDGKIWRTKQKCSHKRCRRTNRWRLHSSNNEATWWQSTEPLRTHLLPDIRYQRQRIYQTNQKSIKGLLTKTKKLISLNVGSAYPKGYDKKKTKAMASHNLGV